MSRLRGLRPDEWSGEVRSALAPLHPSTVKDRGAEGDDHDEPAQRPPSILTYIARQPHLLGPFLNWATALSLNGELPRRDHELLALRAALNCRSDFEWGHHRVYARSAGLRPDDLDRVVAGPDAPGWEPHDAALLRAADELHHTATIREGTWAILASHYDPAQLVEIPLVVGQYTMLSMLANAVEIDPEPGHERLPDPPGRTGT